MTTRDARPGQASHRAPDAPGAGRMSDQRQAADRDTLAVVFWSLVIATLFLFPPVMALAIRGGMRAIDPDFFCAEIDRLERIARQIGSVDRTGIEG